MKTDRTQEGWVRLSNGYDVEIVHGIPNRVSDNGLGTDTGAEKLRGEIAELCGLEVQPDEWRPGENAGEQEAELRVDPDQFEEVLTRLSTASAALFVDRFHTPIDARSVDWDGAEFARDFNRAVEHCGLDPSKLDRDDYFDRYRESMHREAQRLIDEDISPGVEAE